MTKEGEELKKNQKGGLCPVENKLRSGRGASLAANTTLMPDLGGGKLREGEKKTIGK